MPITPRRRRRAMGEPGPWGRSRPSCGIASVGFRPPPQIAASIASPPETSQTPGALSRCSTFTTPSSTSIA